MASLQSLIHHEDKVWEAISFYITGSFFVCVCKDQKDLHILVIALVVEGGP